MDGSALSGQSLSKFGIKGKLCFPKAAQLKRYFRKHGLKKYPFILMATSPLKTLGGICFKNMLVSINIVLKYKDKSFSVCVCVRNHPHYLFCLL